MSHDSSPKGTPGVTTRLVTVGWARVLSLRPVSDTVQESVASWIRDLCGSALGSACSSAPVSATCTCWAGLLPEPCLDTFKSFKAPQGFDRRAIEVELEVDDDGDVVWLAESGLR